MTLVASGCAWLTDIVVFHAAAQSHRPLPIRIHSCGNYIKVEVALPKGQFCGLSTPEVELHIALHAKPYAAMNLMS